MKPLADKGFFFGCLRGVGWAEVCGFLHGAVHDETEQLPVEMAFFVWVERTNKNKDKYRDSSLRSE